MSAGDWAALGAAIFGVLLWYLLCFLIFLDITRGKK